MTATDLLDWMTYHPLPLQLFREETGAWVVVDNAINCVIGSGESAEDALRDAYRAKLDPASIEYCIQNGAKTEDNNMQKLSFVVAETGCTMTYTWDASNSDSRWNATTWNENFGSRIGTGTAPLPDKKGWGDMSQFAMVHIV